jgi:GT2 family glycosyltransferase
MEDKPPIALFCYNRPKHLVSTISSLQSCEDSDSYNLHIFSDGPKDIHDRKNVEQVREIIRQIVGFKSVKVYESERNRGLADSVIDGVSTVLRDSHSVIVVEDDLVFDRFFLKFMTDALIEHEEDPSIFSVSGFSPIDASDIAFPYETYLSPRIHSWGWGIWAPEWGKIDWELIKLNDFFRDKSKVEHFVSGGPDLVPMVIRYLNREIDSWAIRMALAASNLNAYCAYPTRSLVDNHGLDGSGTNCGAQDNFSADTNFKNVEVKRFVKGNNLNPDILKRFWNAYV